MSEKIPDQVVYSEERGYYSKNLPYATNVGAPAIQTDDLVAWKKRGIHHVNKTFESQFKEIKAAYEKLMEDYHWNDLVYNARFSFEPVMGEIYHMYVDDFGSHFLSLIAPHEWKKEYVASFQLNSEKKWIVIRP